MEDHISDRESPQKEVVLIDSLLSIDQYKGIDRSSPPKKHMRDIAEVAAAAEMLLPKGSSRITTAVRCPIFCYCYVCFLLHKEYYFSLFLRFYQKITLIIFQLEHYSMVMLYDMLFNLGI